MDLVDRLRSTRYLGKEFLTWLWCRSDLQEGLIRMNDEGGAAQVWFVDRVVLSESSADGERILVRTEDPSGSREARTALRQGKQVEEARLTIVRNQREWTATIKGEELLLGSVKLPAILTREKDDQVTERLHLLDQLDSMVTSLFQRFASLRLDPAAWEKERVAIEDWIRSDPR